MSGELFAGASRLSRPVRCEFGLGEPDLRSGKIRMSAYDNRDHGSFTGAACPMRKAGRGGEKRLDETIGSPTSEMAGISEPAAPSLFVGFVVLGLT